MRQMCRYVKRPRIFRLLIYWIRRWFNNIQYITNRCFAMRYCCFCNVYCLNGFRYILFICIFRVVSTFNMVNNVLFSLSFYHPQISTKHSVVMDMYTSMHDFFMYTLYRVSIIIHHSDYINTYICIIFFRFK